jgi:thioredoxin 1
MIEIKSQEEFDNLIKTNNNVIVDFWAPWCGPCKMVIPLVERLSEELPNVTFAKVNIDEVVDVPTKYNVRSIPTLIKFKDGNLDSLRVGALSFKTLKEWVE